MTNMPSIHPKEIADTIISTFDVKSCENLDTCIEKAILSAQLRLNTLELADIVESIRGRVRLHINRYISECVDRKIPARVSWSSSDPDRLVGRCFISREDSEDEALEKRRLALMDDVWEAIASSLTPEQFETLCKRFLEYEGFDNPVITGHSHDGGIDLRAVYKPNIYLSRPLDAACQAKRYRKDVKIAVRQLREFFGAIKSQGKNVEIAFFFTTATFSRDAKEFAKMTKLWIADGEQIAYWLVKLSIGIIEKEEKTCFSSDLLIEWLSSLFRQNNKND
jgi:restriction endonuclease Mrr